MRRVILYTAIFVILLNSCSKDPKDIITKQLKKAPIAFLEGEVDSGSKKFVVLYQETDTQKAITVLTEEGIYKTLKKRLVEPIQVGDLKIVKQGEKASFIYFKTIDPKMRTDYYWNVSLDQLYFRSYDLIKGEVTVSKNVEKGSPVFQLMEARQKEERAIADKVIAFVRPKLTENKEDKIEVKYLLSEGKPLMATYLEYNTNKILLLEEPSSSTVDPVIKKELTLSADSIKAIWFQDVAPTQGWELLVDTGAKLIIYTDPFFLTEMAPIFEGAKQSTINIAPLSEKAKPEEAEEYSFRSEYDFFNPKSQFTVQIQMLQGKNWQTLGKIVYAYSEKEKKFIEQSSEKDKKATLEDWQKARIYCLLGESVKETDEKGSGKEDICLGYILDGVSYNKNLLIVAFLPDGTDAVACNKLFAWEKNKWQFLGVAHGYYQSSIDINKDGVLDLVFSTDQGLLADGNETLYMWNSNTKQYKEILTFPSKKKLDGGGDETEFETKEISFDKSGKPFPIVEVTKRKGTYNDDGEIKNSKKLSITRYQWSPKKNALVKLDEEKMTEEEDTKTAAVAEDAPKANDSSDADSTDVPAVRKRITK